MITTHLIPDDIRELYEIHEWRNATGVLATAHEGEWFDLQAVLRGFQLKKSQILEPGGGKSKISSSLDSHFYEMGWQEKRFDTAIDVDGERHESPTHGVDCYKNKVAIEVEWNNKDPFYDRDLNNFRLLFDLRVIDVGVIITRCSHLQDIFDDLGKGSSYGSSTTHMDKLLPRLEGGGGGGCPVLVFGISNKLYVEDL